MAKKYYIDKRVTVSGRQSKIDLDNALNLNDHVQTIITENPTDSSVSAYNNSTSGLTATTVQDAIDELATAPYLKYVALLEQTGVNAPVATVLENTLSGPIVWTYDDVGSYTGTLANAFVFGKTPIFMTVQQNSMINLTVNLYGAGLNDVNSLYLTTGTQAINGDRLPANDILTNDTFIEIRVYP